MQLARHPQTSSGAIPSLQHFTTQVLQISGANQLDVDLGQLFSLACPIKCFLGNLVLHSKTRVAGFWLGISPEKETGRKNRTRRRLGLLSC